MLLHSYLILVSASLSALSVVHAHDAKRPSYPPPKPSGHTSPSQWGPPVPPPNPEPTWNPEPTGWEPSPPVSHKPPQWEPSPFPPVPPHPQHPPPSNAPDPEPERYSPPFFKCYFGKNRDFYQRGFKSGTAFVKILLDGYDDCGQSGSTIDILQQSAPYYPSVSNSSPSLYCRNIGYYKGFIWAVDKFEKKCALQCKDDGQTIGNQAGQLLCNLPSPLRRLSVDLCSRSFKAGCALEFDRVVRTNCPQELNGPRYLQIRSSVCVL